METPGAEAMPDFTEFCERGGLTRSTIRVLEGKGLNDLNKLRSLTDQEIDQLLGELLDNEQLLYLKAGVEMLNTSDKLPEIPPPVADGKDHLRIVLLGKTGSGKSSTGNTILGRKVFLSRGAWASATKTCKHVETVKKGKKLRIVDTPGLYDNEFSEQHIKTEIMKCLVLGAPGPHVFLVAIQFKGRYTLEDYTAYKILKEMFGDDVKKYMIIVFTGANSSEEISTQLFTAPSMLKEVVAEIERYVPLDNIATDEQVKERQLSGLFDAISRMVEGNGHAYFHDDKTRQLQKYVVKKVNEIRKRKGVGYEEAERIFRDYVEEGSEKQFLLVAWWAICPLIGGCVGMLFGPVGMGVGIAVGAAVGAAGGPVGATKYCSVM